MNEEEMTAALAQRGVLTRYAYGQLLALHQGEWIEASRVPLATGREKGTTMTYSTEQRHADALTRTSADLRIEVRWIGNEWQPEGGHRQRYGYTITDVEGMREYVGDDIRSGVSAELDVDDAFASLLSFLSAAVESYPDGENAELFPSWVIEFAARHEDTLAGWALIHRNEP